jgi:hypothetical protein
MSAAVSRWHRTGAVCSACQEDVVVGGGRGGGHACECEFVETLTMWLPARFYDDHVARDLPAGVEVDREGHKVQVRAERSAFSEMLGDARHLVFMAAELGPAYLGLVASARATEQRLVEAGIE